MEQQRQAPGTADNIPKPFGWLHSRLLVCLFGCPVGCPVGCPAARMPNRPPNRIPVEQCGVVEHPRAHRPDLVRTRALRAHGAEFFFVPCARDGFSRTESPSCARGEGGRAEDGLGRCHGIAQSNVLQVNASGRDAEPATDEAVADKTLSISILNVSPPQIWA